MFKFFSYVIILSFMLSCAVKSKEVALQMPVANSIKIDSTDTKDSIILKAAHVVPTANQLDALEDGYIAFVHFGPNTFTRKEWGTGKEDPKVFNLQNLDTDQWCKAMKEGGMKKVIFTAKHHDGFVLWQSRYTKHGIMSSPYKDGKGDILKKLSKSCEKYGLDLGIYLSPADLFQIENEKGLYGNQSKHTERTIPRKVEGRPFKNKTTFTFKVDDYNEYFMNQLFELLTEYGPVHEVWLDGANPKPNTGQTYNYKAWKELIHKLAPKAVIFGNGDIRWIGNESGATEKTEWNVIPSGSQLYEAERLHYKPAEVNTSIREGWFYRDDETQETRSADDVFDIYERAVGGNSIFLLNIPPNREGLFAEEDVQVLKEVGQRIKETYGNDLFANANGPKEVLDGSFENFRALSDDDKSIEINLEQPITINRLLLQEAVATHSERVEKHTLEALIDGEWKTVAKGTNIGFKRILRFSEVTSNKFRLKILKSRAIPTIANISAHYYKPKPPQLSITRSLDGKISITPQKHDFGWKPHQEDAVTNLNKDIEIRYTKDGSEPTKTSKLYEGTFMASPGEIKAIAIGKDQNGSVTSKDFGILKSDWKVLSADSYSGENRPENAFDENPETFWESGQKGKPHYLALDLGENHKITGFEYTPQQESSDGMIAKGTIMISDDGKEWKSVESFEFGNLINDPSKRAHYFEKAIKTRYIKIVANGIAGNAKTAAVAEIGFLSSK